jgi:hypothetical protein
MRHNIFYNRPNVRVHGRNNLGFFGTYLGNDCVHFCAHGQPGICFRVRNGVPNPNPVDNGNRNNGGGNPVGSNHDQASCVSFVDAYLYPKLLRVWDAHTFFLKFLAGGVEPGLAKSDTAGLGFASGRGRRLFGIRFYSGRRVLFFILKCGIEKITGPDRFGPALKEAQACVIT